jgi:hypothetical protein
MERRHFLKLAVGFAAGTAALAATAEAAPLTPQPLVEGGTLPPNEDAHPAVTSESEVDRLKPEEIRYWHRRYWRRRRYWGWHRRYWHRRWRRRYW